jgi:hypothetical protein
MKIKFGMNKAKQFAAIIIAGVLTYSCIPTKSLVIDIPIPASGELPENIQSLTLVSQAIDDDFTNFHTDSLQKQFFEKRFNLDTVIYDLQMADTTLKALGELLFESGRYDYVIPENRFLESPKTSLLATELPWNTVRDFCKTFETDAVLSMDYLKTRVVTQYKNETFFDPFQGGFNSAARAGMKIYYEALFRIYDPSEEKILLREFITDTLYWDDTDTSARSLFSRFTPIKQALTETGIVIALELTDKIAVRWRPESRRYFVKGNANFRQANQIAERGDWLTAVSRWTEIAEKAGSKALKSKAQLNVALGYEILGNLDLAIKWALESYNTMYRPLTYEYLDILNRRKNELKNTK